MTNLILTTDSYKASHYLQYPPNTEYVSSYIEARGVSKDFPRVNKTVFFGLQAFIKKYLLKPITREDINEAEEIFAAHGEPFNREGWEYILEKYYGFLPIQIQALPEGSVVPLSTALVQVINTDPKLPWLTSYVETALLRSIWYPTTVATLSWHIRGIMKQYIKETSDNPDHLDFMLHDFGARGVSSAESAGLGGLAHILSFKGSDTLEALLAARKYYNTKNIIAFSIPAAEHSTITAWGPEGEKSAYENMIDQFGTGLYAVVSDSYDIYAATEKLWGGELKYKVINKGGRVVIRPDSGNPVDVILNLLQILERTFGVSTNSKGFKVLHPSVRLIQGDGVDPISIAAILYTMKKYGWAADNIVFGMGGALLQKVNRDSLKFAMKASAIFRDGTWHDVFKDPVTDPGKKSKKGILAVLPSYETIRQEQDLLSESILKIVYTVNAENYTTFDQETFETIKQRVLDESLLLE